MRLFKQLVVLALLAFAFFGTLALFSMDVIKIEWIGFMEIQPSFDAQEQPLPVPALSVPVDASARMLTPACGSALMSMMAPSKSS